MKLRKEHTNEFYHARALLLGWIYDPAYHWFFDKGVPYRFGGIPGVAPAADATCYHPDNLEIICGDWRHMWMRRVWINK